MQKIKTNTVLLVIIIILLVIGLGYYFLNNSKQKGGEVLNNEESEIIDQKNLISDVYPLYSELFWNSEEASIMSDYNNVPISGFRITSNNISDSQYYKFGISFNKYYDDKLSSLGWIRDNKYDADGPGSSSWAYTKGNNIISFYYHSTEINQKPNQPFSCPCEMTFSIFSGTKNDKKDLISAEDLNLKIKTGIELFMSSTTYKPRIQSNKSACSSILYGYENNYAYAWVYCGQWDKDLKLVTSSSFPVKAQYDLNYQIISVTEGPEGERIEESKKLFGDFYYITAFPGNDKMLSLKESALNKIK